MRGCLSVTTVRNIRRHYKLKSRYQRLRDRGFIDKHAMAARLGIALDTLKVRRRRGKVLAVAYNDKGECLFPPSQVSNNSSRMRPASEEGGAV